MPTSTGRHGHIRDEIRVLSEAYVALETVLDLYGNDNKPNAYGAVLVSLYTRLNGARGAKQRLSDAIEAEGGGRAMTMRQWDG